MSLMQSYRGHLVTLFALGCLCGAASATEDPAPDTDKGRYTMSTTPDGVVRLDTKTGAVSTCNNSASSGWACYAVPDERAALDAEIGRLQAENEKLNFQLASRDHSIAGKIDEPLPKDQALPKSDQLKKAEPKPGESKSAEGTRKLEIPLPSDQDMDRMMGFLEQAWRRLLDMAMRVQKDVSGKI
jgi:hypothetical protein